MEMLGVNHGRAKTSYTATSATASQWGYSCTGGSPEGDVGPTCAAATCNGARKSNGPANYVRATGATKAYDGRVNTFGSANDVSPTAYDAPSGAKIQKRRCC